MRILVLLLTAVVPVFGAATPVSAVRFVRGPINTVFIGSGSAVYSSGTAGQRIRRLLLTQARRDAIGRIPAGALVFVPAAERELFTNPEKFWSEIETHQFHDYSQKSTRVPVLPALEAQGVSDGEVLSVPGAVVKAIATPGYSPGSVSYVIEADGKRIVCTGDLIYGDGQLIDLYSLQDAVPEAKARGYHGYASRAGVLIESLRKVAALHPNSLLPAHGPAINNPQQAIAKLIDRLQKVLQSHFETDALRWYWGDENHQIRSRAVERAMEIMPMAEQAKLPPHIVAIGNSRVILSKTGDAFLVDAGYRNTLPELKRMKAESKIKNVDGMWVTHYHDDHTDYINDVVKAFGLPVYFSDSMTKVMSNPEGFRLPCLTGSPISTQNVKRDGETLRWNEWQFTFWNFPGQTLYHGGLVAQRDSGESYLFVGDSFTPSGMDDYCMQNRDHLRKGSGYEYCLRKIGDLPPETWLINQHVEPMFRYTEAQRERMKAELLKRSSVMAELSPWPDINYMIDESWSRLYPYKQQAQKGEIVTISLQITNHAPASTTYSVRWNIPASWKPISAPKTVRVPPASDGSIEASFRTAEPGLHVVTADIAFGSWQLPSWKEALVRVR